MPTLSKTYYSDSQMTDMNSLARALLANPTKLSPILTYLGGKESQRFPLTMLTEGVGNTKSIDTHEYEYNVQTRVRRVRPVAETVTGPKGAGGALFYIPFPDKWFIKDYVLISKSGVQARIMGDPTPQGNHYLYPLRLVNPDPAAAMPAADTVSGSLFGQLFAPVGTDWSRGNASNWYAPGKVRQKLGTVRKSYQLSGNARDFVMNVTIPVDGRPTNLWMDFEEWQHMMNWKEECEMFYWYGEQTYNSSGETQMKDENGQPVVVPPGIFQQIINKDTYSSLTEGKLKATLRDVYFGMTDARNKVVDLMTGTGGMEEFDRAMKDQLTANVYRQFNDGKFVTGTGRNLSLTGFFTTYEHIDGYTIRLTYNPLFDHGVVAEAGEKHPVTGLPLESYRMVFLDNSNYDGESNLTMVNKKGREFKRWAVSGSIEPRGFETGSSQRASDIDGAAVHFLKMGHVLLRRFDTSLDLQCVAS
jgi:hypothetical protein